jgi:hypothetical protein
MIDRNIFSFSTPTTEWDEWLTKTELRFRELGYSKQKSMLTRGESILFKKAVKVDTELYVEYQVRLYDYRQYHNYYNSPKFTHITYVFTALLVKNGDVDTEFTVHRDIPLEEFERLSLEYIHHMYPLLDEQELVCDHCGKNKNPDMDHCDCYSGTDWVKKKDEPEFMVQTEDHILYVQSTSIRPGEWMYDDSPERGLPHVRKNPGPVEYLGGGYYKIIRHIPLSEKGIIEDVEIVIPL